MNEQVGPKAFAAQMKTELPRWSQMLPQMPALAHGLLRKLNDADLANQNQAEEIRGLRREVASSQRRQYVGMVGAVLLLSAFIVSALDGYAPTMLYGAPLMSWVLGGIGVVLLVMTWPD